MPLVRIETNVPLDAETAEALALKTSERVATLLGKPEKWVMVAVHPNLTLTFGGSLEAAAFVTLKSLGLPESRTATLSAEVCDHLHRELNLDPSRIYIDFADPERRMFGWNRGTF